MRNIYTILIFILICKSSSFAQILDGKDSLHQKQSYTDNLIPQDSSIIFDTINYKKIGIARDGDITEIIEYDSKDSSWLNNSTQVLDLWGAAIVKYNDVLMKAHYIKLDLLNNTAYANVGYNQFGRPLGKPDITFEGQRLVANRLAFNFKTNKGIIYDARIKQEDVFINGEKMKFIGSNDSLSNVGNIINQKNAILSSCNHPDPHFGIRASKLKLIPDKVGVLGPSILEIGHVPTPIILPFGFLPLKKQKRTGLLFPNEYNFSPRWGYGLQNVGWYFPISNKMNLSILTDVYLRGSFGIKALGDYKVIYKNSGNFELSYSNYVEEIPNDYRTKRDVSYRIKLNHVQDAKVNPNTSFGGRIDIETNNYRSLNYNDAKSVLNNTLSSSVNFARTFSGKPYSFNVSMSHSQNTSTHKFSIELPKFNFNLQTIYPFKSKNRVGVEKWYDAIGLNYVANLTNISNTVDSLLFDRYTIENLQQGLSQSVNISSSHKFFKYFNFAPNINYAEISGFKEIHKQWDEEYIDTIKNSQGRVITDTTFGLNSFRRYNASLGFNTKFFGTAQFKKGLIRGIRHQVTPSISLAYSPSYMGLFDTIRLSNDYSKQVGYYTKYGFNPYGQPDFSGEQFGINFGLNNIVEAKYKKSKDTSDTRFKIFDNLNFNTFYNLAADSLKWNPISFSGKTSLFKNYVTLTISGVFDFYSRSEKGERINTFQHEANGKWLRLMGIAPSISTGFKMKEIRSLFEIKENKSKIEVQVKEEFWSLFDNFQISYQINAKAWDERTKKKFEVVNHSISANGSMQLTNKWRLRLDNIGFDLKSKEIIYPSFSFYRDIHCWEMGLDWQPIRGTYGFFIRVKSGTFDFLKAPYNKYRVDAQNFY